MSDLFASGPWGWFVLGGVLLVAEIVLPGAFLLWLGLAALATGALAFLVLVGWQVQVLAFAALAVVSILIGRRLTPAPGAASDRPFLNRRAESQVGRVFILDTPIVDGSGRVRIDDSVWRIAGPDLPVGAKVIVLKVDGTLLVVGAA